MQMCHSGLAKTWMSLSKHITSSQPEASLSQDFGRSTLFICCLALSRAMRNPILCQLHSSSKTAPTIWFTWSVSPLSKHIVWFQSKLISSCILTYSIRSVYLWKTGYTIWTEMDDPPSSILNRLNFSSWDLQEVDYEVRCIQIQIVSRWHLTWHEGENTQLIKEQGIGSRREIKVRDTWKLTGKAVKQRRSSSFPWVNVFLQDSTF